jgi:hypothetical protein
VVMSEGATVYFHLAAPVRPPRAASIGALKSPAFAGAPSSSLPSTLISLVGINRAASGVALVRCTAGGDCGASALLALDLPLPRVREFFVRRRLRGPMGTGCYGCLQSLAMCPTLLHFRHMRVSLRGPAPCGAGRSAGGAMLPLPLPPFGLPPPPWPCPWPLPRPRPLSPPRPLPLPPLPTPPWPRPRPWPPLRVRPRPRPRSRPLLHRRLLRGDNKAAAARWSALLALDLPLPRVREFFVPCRLRGPVGTGCYGCL